MNHGIGELSFLKESFGKVIMGGRVFRTEIRGSLQLGNGFVQFSLLKKNDTEVVFGNIVVRGHGKGMGEERFAIVPIRCLTPRRPTQNANYDDRTDTQDFVLATPARSQISYGPGQDNIKTNLGQISVAIGAPLPSHLD